MKRAFLFLNLTLLSLSAMAQRPMEIEDLFRFQRISSTVLTPDGKNLLYINTSMDVNENRGFNQLMLLNLESKESKVLVDRNYHPSQAQITTDGKSVGFVSSKDGDAQLWEVSLQGGTPQKITNVKEGISLFLYSPAGDKILLGRSVKMDMEAKEFYPQYPKTKARMISGLMYRHWTAWHDYKYNHLFVYPYRTDGTPGGEVDILKGQKFHSPTNPFGGVEEICWNKDGSQVFYTCKKLFGTHAANSTNTDIYRYELKSGETTNISEANQGYDKVPVLSPKGDKLAWMSMKTEGYEADKNRILVLELDKKSASPQDITAKFEQTTDAFVWSNDGSKIYFIAPIKGTHQVFVYDFKAGDIKQITTGPHDYTSILALGNDELVGTKMSMSYPTSIYHINKEGQETQLENHNNELLSKIQMGKVEKRMIPSTDNKEILTWVIYPPNFDPSKKYPTLLYCQGGPQSMVSQFFSYRWNFQMMAAKGYIVVAPNRRGLPGFGQEWNDQIQHDYGGQAMKDYLSAIDALAKEPYVDKDKLGAVGASFGGYSVYWLAGNHEKRFKAFISHCGMFNMESWYGTTEEMFFANADNGPYWEEKNKENYAKHSPHKYVDKWDTPILIIHNELDYRVPLSEGMQAFTAAQQKGIPSKFLYFPDEGHWVSKPQNALLWQEEFFNWLNEWLKPNVQK